MGGREESFSYGPLARGTLYALIALGPEVAIYFPGYLPHYVVLVLCLALGLRPFLEVTGLTRLWARIEAKLPRRWNEKALAKHRAEIEARERQKRLRYSLARDTTELSKPPPRV